MKITVVSNSSGSSQTAALPDSFQRNPDYSKWNEIIGPICGDGVLSKSQCPGNQMWPVEL
jgi:hypothetical protein